MTDNGIYYMYEGGTARRLLIWEHLAGLSIKFRPFIKTRLELSHSQESREKQRKNGGGGTQLSPGNRTQDHWL